MSGENKECLITGQTAAREIRVQRQIEEYPGVLVEQLSPLVISSTTWRVVQQIDLKLLTQQGEKLLDNWRALTQFYKTTKNNAQRQQQLKNIY